MHAIDVLYEDYDGLCHPCTLLVEVVGDTLCEVESGPLRRVGMTTTMGWGDCSGSCVVYRRTGVGHYLIKYDVVSKLLDKHNKVQE